jgi:hypothetical protein
MENTFVLHVFFVVIYDIFFFVGTLVFPPFDGHPLFFGVGTSSPLSAFVAT